jgi:hypothetical protein
LADTNVSGSKDPIRAIFKIDFRREVTRLGKKEADG